MPRSSTTFKEGNEVALKWTEEKVQIFVDKMTYVLLHHTTHKGLCSIYGLMALAEHEEYEEEGFNDFLKTVIIYRDLWHQWKDRLKDQAVYLSFKKIESIIEHNLFRDALNNNTNTAMAIFGLKNNYGWADRQELDIGEGLKIQIVDKIAD